MSDQDVIDQERAADGGVLPGATRTAGDFINQLEDGQFSGDLYSEMVKLGGEIEEVAAANGGKAKGTLVLKIEMTKEDGAFKISSDFSIKAPKMPRARSIMWTDPNGNFTRFPPGQHQMFGLKHVGGGAIRTL